MSTVAKIPSAVGQSQDNCKYVLTTNKALGSVSVEEVGSVVKGSRQMTMILLCTWEVMGL